MKENYWYKISLINIACVERVKDELKRPNLRVNPTKLSDREVCSLLLRTVSLHVATNLTEVHPSSLIAPVELDKGREKGKANATQYRRPNCCLL